MSSVERLLAEWERADMKAAHHAQDNTAFVQRACAAAMRAALREQPEARDVVDDVTRDAARWRKLIANTKTDHIWHFVLSEEHKEGHDHFLDVIDALPLTAAQQPVQELIRFDYTNADGQPDSKFITHDEMRERYADLREMKSAPPSAPVGAKTLQQFMAEQEAKHPGIHDKVEAAADELRASLTQQPAQAPPGDGACWCLTCRPQTLSDMRFVVCPICGNKRCPHANDHRNACTDSNAPGQKGSAYEGAPTPPGDDAAGGGHG